MTIEALTRDEWLAKRRESIQASEVAAILREDPRRGPLDVYASKVLGAPDLAAADWLQFGRDVEAGIASMYATKTGRPVRDLGATTITIHPDIPWLGATLDRQTDPFDDLPAPDGCEGPGALELKHFSPFQWRRDPITGERVRTYVTPEQWAEAPPLENLIQNHTQSHCAGWEWSSLASLHPGYQLVWVDQPRNDDWFAVAYPLLEDFWRRVQDKDPPPPDGPRCLDAVKRLYSAETGETVELDAAALELANEWERAKAAGRKVTSVIKECEAKIRAEIQDATFGQLPDGTLLTLKTTKRKGYTRTVEASEFRTLRRTRPKL